MKKMTMVLMTLVALLVASLPTNVLAMQPETGVEAVNVTDEAVLAGIPDDSQGEIIPGEVIVVMQGTGGDEEMETFGALPSNTSSNIEVTELMSLGATIISESKYDDDGADTFDADCGTSIKLVHSNLNTDTLIAELGKMPGVVSVEPNRVIYDLGQNDDFVCDVEAEIDPLESIAPQVIDYTHRQYMADTRGINVEGWNGPSRNTDDSLVVAVMDTGVDYVHEDLRNIMWNEGLNYKSLVEIGGGMYGFNATASVTGDPMTWDPMDDHSHGTHCAGIIAAEWNDYGVSGISNGAKIMAVRAANTQGQFTVAAAVAGINYIMTAIEAGVNVKVVSNSWGGPYGSNAIRLAVERLSRYNVVITFASGNDHYNSGTSPLTAYDLRDIKNLIVVNAVDSEGKLADFSNYSANYTDVAAPGVDIYSTVPRRKAKADPEYSRAIFKNDFDNPATGFRNWTVPDPDGVAMQEVARYGMNESKCLGVASLNANVTPSVTTRQGDIGMYAPRYLAFNYKLEHKEASVMAVKVMVRTESGEYWDSTIAEKGADHWKAASVALPEDTDYDNFEVKFEFKSANAGLTTLYNDAVYYLDNVILTNDALPYDYMSGTSMATPVVSGEAAVLMSKFPNDNPEKIAARIIGSVSSSDNLRGTSVSEGIVNLKRAIDGDINPVLFSATVDEKTEDMTALSISGQFFGENGTVTVDDVIVETTLWNDNTVKIRVPNNLAHGEHSVSIRADGREGHRILMLSGEENSDFELTNVVDFFGSEKPESMITIQGKIYSLMVEDDGKGAIYEYDPKTDSMSLMTYIVDHQIASNLVAVDGEIALLTVNSLYKRQTYELLVVNPKSARANYTEISFTEKPVSAVTLVNNNGTLLACGGIDTSTMSATADIYEINMKELRTTTVGTMATARGDCKTFTSSGESYLIYGRGDKMSIKTSLEKIVKNPDDTYGTIEVVASLVPEGLGPEAVIGASVTSYINGAIVTGIPKLNTRGSVVSDTYQLVLGNGARLMEMSKLFSYAQVANTTSCVCDGRYYVMAQSNIEGRHIVLGSTEIGDVPPEYGDVPSRNYIYYGDLELSYDSCIEYIGAAVKYTDLNVQIKNVETGTIYTPSSVTYKNNKNAGTGHFVIKKMKTSKEEKALQKALAYNIGFFTIEKRTLTSENTEVKVNKKGKVTSVKFVRTFTNNKGKTITKKYTIPKKEYVAGNGTVTINLISRNYQGSFTY